MSLNGNEGAVNPQNGMNNMMMHQILMPNMEALLPSFSGDSSENFGAFWKKFDRVAKEYGWRESTKILWFSSRLIGEAKQVWDSLMLYEEDEADNFEVMIDKFKEFFAKSEDFSKSLTMEDVKVNKEEPIVSIKLKIENSVRKYLKNKLDLSSPHGKEFFDQMAFEQLLKAVPQDWKEKILRGEINSFGKAIELLEKEKGLQRKINEVGMLNQENGGRNKFDELLNLKDRKIAELEESLNLMRIRREDGNGRQVNKNNFRGEYCNYCRRNGHSNLNCRWRNDNRDERNGRSNYVSSRENNRATGYRRQRNFGQRNENVDNFLE